MTSLLRLAARLVSFTSAAMLLGMGAANAQTQFSPGAAEVRAFLARASNNAYAAAYGGGLYRSTDNPAGTNWTRLNLPNNDRYLTSMAGTTTTVLVGAEEGLYTSTDGTTFTKRLFEPVSAVAAHSSGTVLAAIKGLGILRSTDNGVTFTPSDNGDFAGTDITALAEDPSTANVFYAAAKPDGAGNRGGIYKTTDGGQNWALTAAIGAIADKGQVFGLAVDNGGNAYAAVFRLSDGGGGVYKLTGGAGAWALQGNTFGNVSVHRDANTPANIWSGALRLGITRQVGGAGAFNYEAPNTGNQPAFFFTSVNAIATLPGTTTTLKALKGAGVWRATSISGQATTWTRVNFPGADRVLSASGVAGSANALLLGLHAGGVWRTSAANVAPGNPWNPPIVTNAQADFSFFEAPTAVNAFVSVWELAASPTNPNLIYAATGNVGMHYLNDNVGVFRFNGTAWQGIRNTAGFGAPYNIVQEGGGITLLGVEAPYGVALLKGDDNVVFASILAGGGRLLRRTADTNWSTITQPVANVTPQIRTTVTAAGGKVIALPFDDRPMYSTNGGLTFTQANVAQGGFERLRFFAVAENPTNANNWVGVSNKGVYASTDGGVSWTRKAAAFAQHAFTAVGFKSTGRAFIADFAGNRYCSADGGNNWSSAGAALRAGVNAIRTVNGALYYLTDGAGAQREDGTC